MEAKHWAGLIVAGAAAIALAIFMNHPKDLSNAPGARRLVPDVEQSRELPSKENPPPVPPAPKPAPK
jgi:hypothetical protein